MWHLCHRIMWTKSYARAKEPGNLGRKEGGWGGKGVWEVGVGGVGGAGNGRSGSRKRKGEAAYRAGSWKIDTEK